MAYQTGTVTGTDSLISALSTFMQANGWTLVDTIASDDLVLSSPGSSAKFPMVMRIADHDTTSQTARKLLSDPVRCVNQIYVRGYHLWSTMLSVPVNQAFSTGSGSLSAGTYWYRVSALGAKGETLASVETSQVLGSTGSVVVNWGPVKGAVGYNVYGRTSGSEQKLITVWGSNQTTWIDQGTISPSGALPVSNTAHGGINEYGLNGYSLTDGMNGNTGQGLRAEWRLDGAFGPVQPTGNQGSLLANLYYETNHEWNGYYLGGRLFMHPDYASSGSRFRVFDFATGDHFYGSGNPQSLTFSNHAHAPVYNPVLDKWLMYCLSSANTTSGNQPYDGMWIYDYEGDSWVRAAQVPWTSVNQQNAGGFMLWDGQDTIYICPASSATAWWKYSIAGQSYTQLATLPTSRQGLWTWSGTDSVTTQVYVPATVSGFSSDVIYCLLDTSTTLYCYNVGTNTWNDSAHGTPNLTLPLGGYYYSHLVKDPYGYMYYFRGDTNNLLYRIHNANTVNGWVGSSVFEGSSGQYSSNLLVPQILSHPVGSVRVHPTRQSTYYFFGSQDSIAVAINNGGLNKFYWLWFGRISSRRRQQIMTQSGSTSAGSLVTVNVDSTTGYFAGDTILLWDPTNATIESTQINAINSTSQMVITSLANNYSSGTLIGVDPFQTGITGDSGQMSCPADMKGFRYDQVGATYWVLPTGWMRLTNNNIDQGTSFSGIVGSYTLFATTSPDGGGYQQPIEPMIFMSNVNIASSLTGQARNGYLGTIPSVFFLPVTPSPGPQALATLNISGKNYLFFPQQQTAKNSGWNYGVVLGTTN